MKTKPARPFHSTSKCLRIPADDVFLHADLQVPGEANALVIFAYEFGRSTNHPRTRHVARIMREHGLGTLLCDLLTEAEEIEDETNSNYRNNARLLAKRLLAVTKWAKTHEDTKGLRIGYFGVCTGGSASLIAAAKACRQVAAVVSRGGRLDLATKAVPKVKCPTLLIVGGDDPIASELCREAIQRMTCEKELVVIEGASDRFGEPGKLESMAQLAAKWLRCHLREPAEERMPVSYSTPK